jgi:hypothetical protein
VLAQFYTAYGELSCLGDGLSDELVFDENAPNATYPNYRLIDQGNPGVTDNSIEETEVALGQFRLYADTLLARAAIIQFTDSSLRSLALFTGNFYGGVARYLYAAYFGLDTTNGGGCINLGPFIPSSAMYDLALQKIAASVQYGSQGQKRMAHTMMARIHLIKGEYPEAQAEAAQGMTNGAAELDAEYSTEAENFWWVTVGAGRVQFTVDPRFPAYLNADPKESDRIKIAQTDSKDSTVTLYMQVKYPQDASPIPFMTWQENQLILAEVASRAGDNTSALALVNEVRVSHGLDARTATNIDSIYIERDKELFCTGARLIDERRFNKWHLPAGWRFLPITQRERTANSHLH